MKDMKSKNEQRWVFSQLISSIGVDQGTKTKNGKATDLIFSERKTLKLNSDLIVEVNKPYEDGVKWLLNKGASANAKGDKGLTALETAVSRGFKNIVKILLDRGAIITDNAIELAKARGGNELATWLYNIKQGKLNCSSIEPKQRINEREEGTRMVSFGEMYEKLQRVGPGYAVSSRGTSYHIEAINGNIVAFPASGRVTVHEDCWGEDITCQQTRAGGIYNGSYTIFDWYREH